MDNKFYIDIFYKVILKRIGTEREIATHITPELDIGKIDEDFEKVLRVLYTSDEYSLSKTKENTLSQNKIDLNSIYKKISKQESIYTFSLLFASDICKLIGKQDESIKYFKLHKSKLWSSKKETLDFYDNEKEDFNNISTVEDLNLYRDNLLSNKKILASSLLSMTYNDFENLPETTIFDIINSALQIYGLNRKQSILLAECITNKTPLEEEIEKELSKNASGNQPIIIGGFLSSGSSAVFDYLRGNKMLETILNRDIELPIVNEYFLLKENLSQRRKLYFLMKFALGIFLPTPSHHDKNLHRYECNMLKKILSGEAKIRINEYLYQISLLIHSLNNNSDKKSQKLFKNFMEKFAGIENGEKKLLLNQAPTAMSVESIEVYPEGTTFIAVMRDPRDQFTRQIQTGALDKGIYKDVDGFIAKYIRDQELYEKKKNFLIKKYNFLEICYEDFVVHKKYRTNILEHLSINNEWSKNYFFPDDSIKNIGIHKNHHDQKSIQKIEQTLSAHIWSH